jgi:hypothetical protein
MTAKIAQCSAAQIAMMALGNASDGNVVCHSLLAQINHAMACSVLCRACASGCYGS